MAKKKQLTMQDVNYGGSHTYGQMKPFVLWVGFDYEAGTLIDSYDSMTQAEDAMLKEFGVERGRKDWAEILYTGTGDMHYYTRKRR